MKYSVTKIPLLTTALVLNLGIPLIAVTLHQTAWNGNLQATQDLLNADGIDVNTTDTLGNTPLHFASQRGHIQVVQTLLATRGINVNATNNTSWTPLHMAAFHGKTEIVRMLLTVPDIDINHQTNNNGWTPLHCAIYGNTGTTNMIAMLLTKGADITITDFNGKTPLDLATPGSPSHRLLTLAQGMKNPKSFAQFPRLTQRQAQY